MANFCWCQAKNNSVYDDSNVFQLEGVARVPRRVARMHRHDRHRYIRPAAECGADRIRGDEGLVDGSANSVAGCGLARRAILSDVGGPNSVTVDVKRAGVAVLRSERRVQ